MVPADSELCKESETLVSARSDVTVVGNRTELANSLGDGERCGGDEIDGGECRWVGEKEGGVVEGLG